MLQNGCAAIVIDDVVPSWKPHAAEIRGPAEALDHPASLICIRPEPLASWGVSRVRYSASATPTPSAEITLTLPEATSEPDGYLLPISGCLSL